MSDKIKGQMAKAPAPHGYCTSGPRGWPNAGAMGGPSQNVADVMRTGKGSVNADQLPASVSIVTRSGDIKSVSDRKSMPPTTHILGSAIDEPRKAHYGGQSGHGKRRNSVAEDSGRY
jgi:hypothetical protein